MKTIHTLMAIGVMIAARPEARGETLAETLERGVQLEETQGDPAGALKVYEEVLGQETQSREIGAEARYRTAMCLIELGEEAKARVHLEALLENAAEGKQWAKKAAERLGRTLFVQPAPWKSGEIALYRTLGPAGQDMGFMLSAVEEIEVNGEDRWASYFIRSVGQSAFSRVEFSKESYEPVKSRFAMEGFGDSTLAFAEEGAVRVTDSGDGKLKWERKAGEATGLLPLLDNDQVIQLLRVLPQGIGTKVQSEIATPLNHGTIPFTMEVTAEEAVKTDAGDFECVKIVTNIGQDFWVSRDEAKRLIKIKAGPLSIEASKFTSWNPAEAGEYVSRTHGVRLGFPAGVLSGPPQDQEKGLHVEVFPTDFSSLGGAIEIKPVDSLPEGSRASSKAWAAADLAAGAKNFDEFKIMGQAALKVAGMDAWASQTMEQRGELEGYTHHVHLAGPKKSVRIRLVYPKGGEEAVAKLATELLSGIKID